MVLFVPDFYDKRSRLERGKDLPESSGYGHLVRSIKNALYIGGDILVEDVYRVDVAKIVAEYKSMMEDNGEQSHTLRIVSKPKAEYFAVLVDKRYTTKEEVFSYSHYGAVIGIDLGGEGRKHATFLIDTLPNTFTHTPNMRVFGSSSKSNVERKKESWDCHCSKILYYTNGNQLKLEEELEMIGNILSNSPVSITLVSANTNLYKDISKQHKNLSLRKFSAKGLHDLRKFDLFVSHFGISIYEALAANVPVLLFNPSEYHNTLSKLIGFPRDMYSTHARNITNYIQDIVNNELSYSNLIEKTKNNGLFFDSENFIDVRELIKKKIVLYSLCAE